MLDETTIVADDISEEPRYVAQTKDGWGVVMIGTDAEDGSDLDHTGVIGLAMTNFKIGSSKIKKARVRNKRGKWLPYKSGFDKELGDGTNITGIEIVGAGYIASVHVKGGSWLPLVRTSDIEGAVIIGENFIIDAIWVGAI